MSPLAEKNVKQKPVPDTHQDVTFLKRHFTAFNGKKGTLGAAALYGGKREHTGLPSWQSDRPWLLVKRK